MGDDDRDVRDRLIRMEERLLHATRESLEMRTELKELKVEVRQLLDLFENAKGVKWMLSDSRIISLLFMFGAAVLGFVYSKFGIRP